MCVFSREFPRRKLAQMKPLKKKTDGNFFSLSLHRIMIIPRHTRGLSVSNSVIYLERAVYARSKR